MAVPPPQQVSSALPADEPVELQRFDIDAEASSVRVVAKSIAGSHPITAERFEGFVCYSPSAPEHSQVVLSVDMRSVRASPEVLTNTVKGPKLLEVQKYPEARFRSSEVQATAGTNRFRLRGDLFLHGIEAEIEVVLVLQDAANVLVASSDFQLARATFDLEYKGFLEAFLRDDATVQLRVTARRADSSEGCVKSEARELSSHGAHQ